MPPSKEKEDESIPEAIRQDSRRIPHVEERPSVVVTQSSRITQKRTVTSETVEIIDIPDDEDTIEDAPHVHQKQPSQRITHEPHLTDETFEIINIPPEDDDPDVIEDSPQKVPPRRKSPRLMLEKLDVTKSTSMITPRTKEVIHQISEQVVEKVTGQGDSKKKDRPSLASLLSSLSKKRQMTLLEMSQKTAGERISQSQHSVSSAAAAHPQQTSKPRIPQSQPAVSSAPQQPSRRRIPQSQPSAPAPGGASRQRLPQSQPSAPAPAQQSSGKRITQSQPVPGSASRRRLPHPDSEVPKKKGKWVCTWKGCDYSVDRSESFKMHMARHTGEKFKCSQCPKDYYSIKSLNHHVKTDHLKIDRCYCSEPGCTWSGRDYGLRKVHLYESHGIGPVPACPHPDCRERGHFTNYRTLERHLQNYHREKDMECPFCSKKYKEVANLANHIAVHHQGKAAQQCEECGKFFTSKKSLKVHKETEHK